jgi:hypothetical protein
MAADFTRSELVRTAPGLITGMWNHGRFMERIAERKSIAWPVLTGQELADLSAYLASVGTPRRVAPGAR